MLRNSAPNSAPTPRFAIGEEVMVRSALDSTRNIDCTVVVDRQWFEGKTTHGWYCGWQYVVSKHLDAWAMESSIKPRPWPAKKSWCELSRELHDQVSVESILS